MDIKKSYEGLEGSNVYIYSGKYSIIASDDGINSAGDTDENCEGGQGGQGGQARPEDQGGQGGPGGQGFPGSQDFPRSQDVSGPPDFPGSKDVPGGPGFPGSQDVSRGPGFPESQDGQGAQGDQMNPWGGEMQNQCYIFHIFIYGGEIYVNTESDGLDANGNINIYGGNLEIWGMKSGGDGDPIDLDGTLTITGGTILAGGNQGMEPIHKSEKTLYQNFIYSTNSFNANKEISIQNGNNEIRSIKIPKNINYLFYTSKDTTSSYSFSEGTTNFKSGAQSESSNSSSFYFSSLNILFYFLLLVILMIGLIIKI